MTREEKAARNVIIAERRLANVSMSDIAKEFNLTLGAVWSICKVLGLGGKRSNKKATYRKPIFTEEHLKAEEDRRKQVVADRCEGFVYVGNYTGSDGTADIKCEACGNITTRAWITIKQGRVRCCVCEKREAEQRTEQKRLKAEDEKKRKAVQAYFVKQARFKSKQLEMRVCLHCGKTFFSTNEREMYCSPKCARATNNSIKKDRRLRKLKDVNYDSTISLPRVFDRDNGVCYLCGEPCDWDDYEGRDGAFIVGKRYPSIDHVVALHDGGLHTWDNVRLAHHWCNSCKR